MAEAFTLQQLANATDTLVQGDASYLISAVASIEQADATDISFIRDKKYVSHLESNTAGALILHSDLASTYAGNCLISTNPYLTYAQVVNLVYPRYAPTPGVDPSAVIAEDVELGEGVYIGPQVVIESGCKIGAGSVIMAGCVIGMGSQLGRDNYLHANVTLATETQIGDRVMLHSGVMLGADGFGFVPEAKGWYKIPQIGNVVLGDDVEIGANTVIDRAAMGSTKIGNGVKLDNLIHIAHNVQIGDHTVIAACTGVAGSANIGSHCQISGKCSIAGHLTIADHTTLTATSLVLNSITKPGVYSSGITVNDHVSWRKNAVRFHQLDQLSRRVKALEKQLVEKQKPEDAG